MRDVLIKIAFFGAIIVLLAGASTYAGWTTINAPGNFNTAVYGIDGNRIVGSYYDLGTVGYSDVHGFLYDGTNWTTLDYPGAASTIAFGIDGDKIVGFYRDSTGGSHGFLFDCINWVTIDYPGAVETEVLGIDGNRIFGCYWNTEDGFLSHGFVYDGANWVTIDYPGEIFTTWITDIDGDKIIGNCLGHGFVYDGTGWTVLDYPGADWTIVGGIDGDRIVGYYPITSSSVIPIFPYTWQLDIPIFPSLEIVYDGINRSTLDQSGTVYIGQVEMSPCRGFVYDGTNWFTLDYPGAVNTFANGIDGDKIVGSYLDPAGNVHGFVYEPWLYVVIPGINYDGEKMIEAARTFSKSEYIEWTIAEVDALGDEEIREQIARWSQDAKTNGWDLIVNINMDLEDYDIVPEYFWPPWFNRWESSTEWAGKAADIVSEEFEKIIPEGRRILYAHSAGGDAVFDSLLQSGGRRLFDDINILNGRIGVADLYNGLSQCGYAWSQVKIFTSQNDFPSRPALLWFKGSISNKDAATNKAREGAWVHVHCNRIWKQGQTEPIKPKHNTLRDYFDCQAEFEVYTQRINLPQYQATFIDAILKDWRSK